MRISDWSSDVCSSDLIAEPQIETGWRPGATQLFQGRRIVVIGNACDRSADHASMAWPYTIGLDGVATPAPALVKHAPLGDWVGGDRIGSTEQLEQPGGKQHAQRVAGGAVNDTSHFAISQTGTPRSEAGCRRR